MDINPLEQTPGLSPGREVTARRSPEAPPESLGSIRDQLLAKGTEPQVADILLEHERRRLRDRQEKLDRIRREIEDGTYSRPAHEVARKMVEFFQHGEPDGE